jgi:ribonuclease BN (tRNA processing enzyme)
MSAMRLLPLGTTGYHPNDLRQTACYLLPSSGLVFDAGTGAYRLARCLETDELDIFLSHAHLDHVVGLTYLLETRAMRPLRRLTIHGAAKKLAAVREHLFHIDLFPVPIDAEWRPLPEAGPITLVDGGKVTFFHLTHPGGSLGYRVDWPGKSLAYVTDATVGQAKYVDAIRGVDLLLHECNFSDDESADFATETGHSRTSEVAALAKSAGVGRLLLIHLAPHRDLVDPIGLDAARRIFPNTDVAQDLKTVEF